MMINSTLASLTRPLNLIIIIFIGFLALPISAQDNALPTTLNAALTIKIASFETALNNKKNISILVINDKALHQQFKRQVGRNIAGGVLMDAFHDSDINQHKPDIIFIGRSKSSADIILYAEKNNVLTITSKKSLAEQGIALALFDDEGSPGILLNLVASRKHRLNWNPEILDFVSLLKE